MASSSWEIPAMFEEMPVTDEELPGNCNYGVSVPSFSVMQGSLSDTPEIASADIPEKEKERVRSRLRSVSRKRLGKRERQEAWSQLVNEKKATTSVTESEVQIDTSAVRVPYRTIAIMFLLWIFMVIISLWISMQPVKWEKAVSLLEERMELLEKRMLEEQMAFQNTISMKDETIRDLQSMAKDLQSIAGLQQELLKERDKTKELETTIADLEADFSMKEALCLSRLDARQWAVDKLLRTVGWSKEELKVRAEEADDNARKVRAQRGADLKTLHHGLHWMWQKDHYEKKVKQLREELKAMKLKAAADKNAIEERDATIKELNQHLKTSSGAAGM